MIVSLIRGSLGQGVSLGGWSEGARLQAVTHYLVLVLVLGGGS
jgi:hypothetical protein